MISVRLMGGLGNQLFQYSFGRSLSIQRGEDLSFFTVGEVGTDRPLDILNLNTDIRMVDVKKLPYIYRLSNSSLLFRIGRRIVRDYPSLSGKLTVERYPGYRIPEKKYSCFDGYWQSFKYFSPYYERFSHQLTPRNIAEAGNTHMKVVKTSESVSMHIRRGDYQSSKGRNPHFCLKEEYYRNAVREFEKILPKPLFVVFSDDYQWVKSNFVFLKDYNTVYAEKSENQSAVTDLYLMSECNHNIIANSSFSWWGAWLNRNPNKIVIAPSKWYNDWFKYNIDDLLPEKWIRIPL